MTKIRRFLGLWLTLIAGCAEGAGLMWEGQAPMETAAGTIIVRDQSGWDELWRKAGQPPPQALPNGMQAIGIFAGPRSRAGYRIVMAEPQEETRHFIVRYRIAAPESQRPAPAVMTAPYAIRLLPADKPVLLQAD